MHPASPVSVPTSHCCLREACLEKLQHILFTAQLLIHEQDMVMRRFCLDKHCKLYSRNNLNPHQPPKPLSLKNDSCEITVKNEPPEKIRVSIKYWVEEENFRMKDGKKPLDREMLIQEGNKFFRMLESSFVLQGYKLVRAGDDDLKAVDGRGVTYRRRSRLDSSYDIEGRKLDLPQTVCDNTGLMFQKLQLDNNLQTAAKHLQVGNPPQPWVGEFFSWWAEFNKTYGRGKGTQSELIIKYLTGRVARTAGILVERNRSLLDLLYDPGLCLPCIEKYKMHDMSDAVKKLACVVLRIYEGRNDLFHEHDVELAGVLKNMRDPPSAEYMFRAISNLVSDLIHYESVSQLHQYGMPALNDLETSNGRS